MSTITLKSLHHIKSFDFDAFSNIEAYQTIESTAATITRFKLFNQGVMHNLIHKKFRSEWVGGGQAELNWYKNFAPQIEPRISPRFYGGDLNKQMRHCILFLEDVTETHYKVSESEPITVGNCDPFQSLVDLLLRLHIPWWNHQSLKNDVFMHPQGGPLRLAHAATPQTINSYVQSLQRAFPEHVDNLKPELSLDERLVYEQVIQSWEKLLTDRVSGDLNLTLIHGDFHIWNIFFPRHAKRDSYLVVDWETYKRGIGVYDLAYLLITCLDAPMRRQKERALLRQYHDGLLAAGIKHYSWQDCVQDYRLSIIANLFPPLLWKSAKRAVQALTAFKDWDCKELFK